MNFRLILVCCWFLDKKIIEDRTFVFSKIDYRVQQNVLTAIQHWHQRTCIRFEPYNPQLHWDIQAKITIEDTGSGYINCQWSRLSFKIDCILDVLPMLVIDLRSLEIRNHIQFIYQLYVHLVRLYMN